MIFLLRKFSPIWIYNPLHNLCCLGIKLGFGRGLLYADLVCWGNTPGHLYVRVLNGRYHSNIRHPFKWRQQG